MPNLNSKHSVSEEFKNQALDLLNQSMIKINNCFDQLSEEQIWWSPVDSANSIGNLILHSCGNLRQWGITGIQKSQDTRHREAEFLADSRVSKTELLELCKVTIREFRHVVRSLTEAVLLAERIIQNFRVTVLQAILHTTTHFAGHTHQIIMLTRRQLGKNYQFAWQPDEGQNELPL